MCDKKLLNCDKKLLNYDKKLLGRWQNTIEVWQKTTRTVTKYYLEYLMCDKILFILLLYFQNVFNRIWINSSKVLKKIGLKVHIVVNSKTAERRWRKAMDLTIISFIYDRQVAAKNTDKVRAETLRSSVFIFY